MLSMVLITASGDTEMLPGELVEATIFQRNNVEIIEEGGEPAKIKEAFLRLPP